MISFDSTPLCGKGPSGLKLASDRMVPQHLQQPEHPLPQPEDDDEAEQPQETASPMIRATSTPLTAKRPRSSKHVSFATLSEIRNAPPASSGKRCEMWYSRNELCEMKETAKQQARSVLRSKHSTTRENCVRGLEEWTSTRIRMEIKGRVAACVKGVLREQKRQRTVGIPHLEQLRHISKRQSQSSIMRARHLATTDRLAILDNEETRSPASVVAAIEKQLDSMVFGQKQGLSTIEQDHNNILRQHHPIVDFSNSIAIQPDEATKVHKTLSSLHATNLFSHTSTSCTSNASSSLKMKLRKQPARKIVISCRTKANE